MKQRYFESGEGRTLLPDFDVLNMLEALLDSIRKRKLSDYEDETKILKDLLERREIIDKVILTVKEKESANDSRQIHDLLLAEEKQKARIGHLLMLIKEENDRDLDDVNERINYYRSRVACIRKARTGMTAYLRSARSGKGYYDILG